MGSQQSLPTTSSTAATPPPGCPMHVKDSSSSPSISKNSPPSTTPYTIDNAPTNHNKTSFSRQASSSQSIDHAAFEHAPRGMVNSYNNIPDLKQQPAPGQSMALPLERTISSIPRAPSLSASSSSSSSSNVPPSACPVAHGTSKDSTPPPPPPSSCPVAHGSTKDSKSPTSATKEDQWEYPSPQQFYNALVRKGWETPEESVEMMVNIHNWLNEEAWSQVRRWEERFDGGDRSSLASFQGRPQELSPKARYHLLMGKILPSSYASIRPFDRHDWIVHRPAPAPTGGANSYMSGGNPAPYTEHRYVIDYYHLADDREGNPVFSLDVRPAVDDFSAVQLRVGEWWKVKKESLFGSSTGTGVGEGNVPGVRVTEN